MTSAALGLDGGTPSGSSSTSSSNSATVNNAISGQGTSTLMAIPAQSGASGIDLVIGSVSVSGIDISTGDAAAAAAAITSAINDGNGSPGSGDGTAAHGVTATDALDGAGNINLSFAGGATAGDVAAYVSGGGSSSSSGNSNSASTGDLQLIGNPSVFLENTQSSPGNIEPIGAGEFVMLSSKSGEAIFSIFDSTGENKSGAITLPHMANFIAVSESTIGFHNETTISNYSKTGEFINTETVTSTLRNSFYEANNTFDFNGLYGEETSLDVQTVSSKFTLSNDASTFTLLNKASAEEVVISTGFGTMSSDISVALNTADQGVLFAAFDEAQRTIKMRIFSHDGSPLTEIKDIKINSEDVVAQIFSVLQLENGTFALFTEDGLENPPENANGSENIIRGYHLSANLENILGSVTLNQTQSSNDNLFPRAEAINETTIAVMWMGGPTAMLQLVGLSGSSSGPTLDSPSNAMVAISALDNAIKTVNIQRSKLGAVSNRLSHTVNNLTNISSNLSAAQGNIEDTDFAKETTDLAKNQILQQASTAMLAQANASKQNVLSLLQG
jgi:flagellin-like hook-associated protein FlgL